MLYAEKSGMSRFDSLVVSEELEPQLQQSVRRILSNIYEEEKSETGNYLGTDGWFQQGMLLGRADKAGDAEFCGIFGEKTAEGTKNP